MGLCKKCRKVEVQPIDIGGGMQVTPPHCPVCVAKIHATRRRERFEAHVAKSGMPRELWTYSRSLGNPELLDWCVAHASDWIWLGGATRVGKTRALARTAVVDTWRREHWPSILWLESASFFGLLADRSHAARAVAMERLDAAKHAELLLLDDIGMERLTDDTRAMLFSAIDYRFTRRLRTWFTSNANKDELTAHIGAGRWPQIRARIAERGTIRTWAGEVWSETTTQVPECAESYWWQDL